MKYQVIANDYSSLANLAWNDGPYLTEEEIKSICIKIGEPKENLDEAIAILVSEIHTDNNSESYQLWFYAIERIED